MASRKSHAKKDDTTHRRRRVSRVGAVKGVTNIMKNAALATGGYLIASFGAKYIPGDNKLMKAGAKIAAAFATSKFVKGETGSALAIGMGVSGVVDLVQNFAPNLISGIGEEPAQILISGINTLGGDDSMGNINQLGDINQLGGDEINGISTLGGIEGIDEY